MAEFKTDYFSVQIELENGKPVIHFVDEASNKVAVGRDLLRKIVTVLNHAYRCPMVDKLNQTFFDDEIMGKFYDNGTASYW